MTSKRTTQGRRPMASNLRGEKRGTIITGAHGQVAPDNPSTENLATVTASGTVSTTGTGIPAVIGLKGTAWTVSNFGTVSGMGSSGVGIDLLAGGKVIDGSSTATKALVAGGGFSVLVFGAAGTIANFATIEATGTIGAAAGIGISLDAGGNVTSGSTTDRKVVISSAQGTAILIGGTAGGSAP